MYEKSHNHPDLLALNAIIRMVDDPPTWLITNGYSSSNMLTKSKSMRKGERFRSLVRMIYALL